MWARVRRWFDGSGWFVGLAVALFVFALLALLLELQSSDLVLWTGTRVTGTEQGGIITYRWQGERYSLNAQGDGSSPAVSVYIDPGDPSNALAENLPERLIDAALIGGPAVLGVAVLVIGGTRNWRWERRNVRRARDFTL